MLLPLMVAAVAGIGLAADTFPIPQDTNVTRVHRLEFPLMLTGSGVAGRNYLLPKATTLYYEQAFPEGFVRYRMYVNVEGIDLQSTTLDDPTTIEPVSAYPVAGAELRDLLADYPLSKDDLASILRSGQLSKDEIRDLLREFSE